MGRIVVRKIRGIRGIPIEIKIALVFGLTILLSTFMHQGWFRPEIAGATEMVPNGTFSGSTGWTFSTATYDSSTTRVAGSGSAKLATSGRNAAAIGTVTQAVSIPAGSTVSTVSLYTQLTTSTENTGDNVSVSLLYADGATSVTILSTGELANGAWTAASASPALTLAQDAIRITISMNTKAGNANGATVSLWVDDLTISYTAGLPCTVNTPTLTVSPTSSLLSAGANMVYTAKVINNDSGAGCGNVTYTLNLGNSNTADFSTTAISPALLSIATGGQGAATFTVTASASAPNGAINTSTISASASGHTSPPNATAQTTVNTGRFPLLHNSTNLQSKYGTWGGNYDCSTCHIKNYTNVKRIQETIQTPIGNRTVVFFRMTASATNAQGTFADDLRTTYATASRNVCEVCHHQTLYHQYSSAKIADRSTNPHYNRKDCTSCHPHSAGFKGAGCDGCHGNPPTSTATLVTSPEATLALGNPPSNAGAHATHVTGEGIKCTTCHSGNTMPSVSKTIQMGFDINNTNWPGFAGTAAFGSFSGHSPLGGGPAYSFVSSKTGTTVNTSGSYRTSCNVYCHGLWAGANGSINPAWIITDGSQSLCGTCHAATAANPPATGKHLTHAGSSAGNYGFSCTKCHPNTSGFNHVNGSVQWRLSSSTNGVIGSTATYTPNGGSASISGQTNAIATSAMYGACNNIYCHSTAQGSNGTSTGIAYTSPKWSDAALGCGGCHADMSGASGTGDHVKHATTYGLACLNCHGSGYTSGSITTATHVNRNIDLKFSNGTIAPLTIYQKGTSFPAGSAAYSSCSNSYCHSNGQSDNAKAAIYRQPVWGTTVTSCGSCHNNMKTFANASSGSHKMHAQGNPNYDCAMCHNGYTASTVIVSTHADRKVNLGFTSTALNTVYSKYSAAGFAPGKGQYGTCSKSSCHGSGKPLWGGDTTRPECFKCHGSQLTTGFTNVSAASVAPGYNTTDGRDTAGNTAATSARVGAHQGHLVGSDNISDKVHCGECHTTHTTVTDATHLNYTTATISFGPLAKKNSAAPSVSRASGVITCNSTYCHGGKMPYGSTVGTDTSPTWNTTAYLTGTPSKTGDCAMCHGCPPTGYTGSSHSGTEALSACNGCHNHVNTDGTFTAGANRALHINGSVEASGGDCLGCHASLKSDTANPDIGNDGVRAINAEFSRTSHHVTGVTLTKQHCAMCHMEGDTTGAVSTLHKNGQIDLRNVDTNTAIVWTGSEHANMDNFCFACHDSNGVSNATVRAIVPGATATNPFADTLTNGYDQVTRAGVIDVKTQFTTTNYSHHAVSGQKYTTSTPLFSASPTRFVSTFTPLGGASSIRDTSAIHCGDCHTNGKWATVGGIGAHGSTNEYMLQTASGTDTTHTSTDYVCFKCHVGSIYSTFGGKTLGGAGGHIAGGNAQDYAHTAGATGISGRATGNGNITGMTCANCHNCGQTGWGGIHGGNATYTDGANASQQTRRFMPGMANSKYIPDGWTTGSSTGCYTLNNTSWSSCNQHPSGGKTVTRLPRATSY